MILSTFEPGNSAVMNTYGCRPWTQGLHLHESSSSHSCSAQPPPCGCSCVGGTLNTSYCQTKPYRSQAGKLQRQTWAEDKLECIKTNRVIHYLITTLPPLMDRMISHDNIHQRMHWKDWLKPTQNAQSMESEQWMCVRRIGMRMVLFL